MAPKSSPSRKSTTEGSDELARVPMLLQDRQYLLDDSQGVLLVRPTTFVNVRDGRLGDGPRSERIVVASGRRKRKRARLLPPVGARRIRSYEVDEELLDPDLTDVGRFDDDTFVQLHVFACAHATLALFEQLLGRRVRWAFPAERLTLVPWGPVERDAYYVRETEAVTFCRYTTQEGRELLLALSRDIVAHETAHAIVDAVAPDLYDACDPDSLTIHEAYGDIAATLQTLLDEAMLFSAYALFDGDTDAFEALGRLGEEFGTDVRRDEGAAALRAATANATFATAGEGRIAVDRWDSHEASSVVVGALFSALRERAESSGREFEAAVLNAARELSRIAVPALHRLPPGEASLADLARALGSAANETSSGSAWMNAILRRLVECGVTDDPASLGAPTPSPEPLDGWPGSAEAIVEANRERLAVPAEAGSLVATATEFDDRTWTKSPRRRVQLRVAWDVEEEHDPGYGFSGGWLFRVGTTAIVDAETGVPLSILTSGTDGDVQDRRGEQLRRWAASGKLLEYSSPSAGLGVTRDRGRLRIAGTARTLHLSRSMTTKKGAVT